MSSQQRLPHELAEVEAHLNAFTPAPSRIDRDQLMYRAGLAAAQSQRSLRQWVLPTMTAAVAAVLAVAATLHVAAINRRPLDQFRRSPVVAADVLDVVAEDKPQEQPWYAYADPPFRFSSRNAPLLAARDRALQFEFEEPTPVLAAGATHASEHVPSMRLLREEFLPQRVEPAMINDEFPWIWLQPWNQTREAT